MLALPAMVWPARRMLIVDRRVWRASSSNRRSVKRQNCHEPVLPADTGAAHATALGAHLRGHPNLSGSRAVRFRSRVRSQTKPNSLTVRPAEKPHLRQRAELVRSLFALS